MTDKPRLEALRTVVKQVIKAKGKKQRDKALLAFDDLNDDGWNTCAVGAFLNDCGINVKKVALCKDSGLGTVIYDFVKPEIKKEGNNFEANVRSKRRGYPQSALRFLNKLIRVKPCTILKV